MKKALSYIIPALLCSVTVILILVGRGAFEKTGMRLMMDLCDAFFVPGSVMTCFGLLIIGTNGGAFDMLAFGVIKLFDLFRRDLTKVKYRTFYDYRQAQKEKKRSYWSYIIVGLVFLVAAAVFLILYKQY